MGQSLDFIKDRATKTISAAREVAATWTWQEMDADAMQAKLNEIIGDEDGTPKVGQEEKAEDAEQVMLGKRGLWDTALDQLHRWNMQGLGMAKNKYRNDPAKLGQLEGLTAGGDSRSETLREALEWDSAWGKLDPAWAPMPGNTRTAFSALRKSCVEELKTDYSDARADWRKEAEKLNQLAAEMEKINVAWYADATRAFPEGTPEGDMIRGTVPTTYSPSAPKPPTP